MTSARGVRFGWRTSMNWLLPASNTNCCSSPDRARLAVHGPLLQRAAPVTRRKRVRLKKRLSSSSSCLVAYSSKMSSVPRLDRVSFHSGVSWWSMRNCSSQYLGTVVSDRSTSSGISVGNTKSMVDRRSASM